MIDVGGVDYIVIIGNLYGNVFEDKGIKVVICDIDFGD